MGLITQVLQGSENLFYQAIHRSQQTWAASASTILDSTLMYGQTATPFMADSLHPIRLFSNLVNTGWLAWDGMQLFNAFQTKDASLLSSLMGKGPHRIAHIAGAVLATGALLAFAKSIYH